MFRSIAEARQWDFSLDILVVDPEAEIRLVFFVAADQVGCNVQFAESGSEALYQLADKPDFDLIFAASELGDMTAEAFARQLRQLDHYGYQPLVFLSSSDESAELVALLESGDDVIIKPFSQQVLLAKILAHKRIRSLYKALETQNRELHAYHKQTERELMIAADVFRQLSANSLQQLPGVSCFVSPYSVFNGDILLLTQAPDGCLYFLVADVTGHGLPAALCTMPLAERFLELAATGQPVGEIARMLNRIHVARIPPYILCAAFLGRFEPDTRSVRYWSGGMLPALVVERGGSVRELFDSMHMAIGGCEDALFDAEEGYLELGAGDRLIVYTDGVTETRGPSGDFWGTEGLMATIAECAGDDALVESVMSRMKAFRASPDLASDDVTMLCLDVDACLAQLADGV